MTYWITNKVNLATCLVFRNPDVQLQFTPELHRNHQNTVSWIRCEGYLQRMTNDLFHALKYKSSILLCDQTSIMHLSPSKQTTNCWPTILTGFIKYIDKRVNLGHISKSSNPHYPIVITWAKTKKSWKYRLRPTNRSIILESGKLWKIPRIQSSISGIHLLRAFNSMETSCLQIFFGAMRTYVPHYDFDLEFKRAGAPNGAAGDTNQFVRSHKFLRSGNVEAHLSWHTFDLW